MYLNRHLKEALMQHFGLHRNIYKLAQYARTQENLAQETQHRFKLLGDWETLKQRNVPDAEIARVTGISRASYYRRKKALNTLGLSGMARRSTRPKRFRQSRISEKTRQLILKLRCENPTYGKGKITQILKRDHRETLSESSVGRILTVLMAQGQIQRYRASDKKTRTRRFAHHAQRWRYGMKATKPGELLQIDHMTVTKNGISFKHFQATCPVTKITIAEIYSQATSRCAARLLAKVREELPFPLISIQVDGGSEFMKDFEKSCAQHTIPLFVLPPKRPQYNGHVERRNRTFREDFYDRKDVLADTITTLRPLLKSAVHKYNTYRPHQNLKGLTPLQYTQNFLETQSHML